MRFAGGEIHHRHDFHCAQATGKVARTGLAALYLAFTDLAKAFDLMGRKGLFQLLRKIECHPKHLVLLWVYLRPFPYQERRETGLFNLAPTFFGIPFSLLFSYAFGSSTYGVD